MATRHFSKEQLKETISQAPDYDGSRDHAKRVIAGLQQRGHTIDGLEEPTYEREGGLAETINNTAEVSGAYLNSGIVKATGAIVDTVNKGIGLTSEVGGALMNSTYDGVGHIAGIFSDDAQNWFDELGDKVYRDSVETRDFMNQAGREIGAMTTEAGDNMRDAVLEQNDWYKEKMAETQRRIEAGEPEFQMKDLKSKDFLLFDVWGGLLENAPTMAVSLYAGNKAGVATQGYGAVANFLAQAGGATMFSTAINASREAESQFLEATEEGLTPEEAMERSERVWNRNFTGNTGSEFAQMALIFLPQSRIASPFWKALATSGRFAGAGTVEALQERAEDDIQNQAGNEEYDWGSLTDAITEKEISRTDAVSFMLGMAFQGMGNVAVNDSHVDKLLEKKAGTVLDQVPDAQRTGDNIADLNLLIQERPDVAEEASKKSSNLVNTSASYLENIQQNQDFITAEVDKAFNGEISPNELALSLANKIDTSTAQSIANDVQAQIGDNPVNTETQPENVDRAIERSLRGDQEVAPVESTARTLEEIEQSAIEDLTANDATPNIDNIVSEFTTATGELQSTVESLREQEKTVQPKEQAKIQKQIKDTERQIADSQVDFDKRIIESNRPLEEKMLDYVGQNFPNSDYTGDNIGGLRRAVQGIAQNNPEMPLSQAIKTAVESSVKSKKKDDKSDKKPVTKKKNEKNDDKKQVESKPESDSKGKKKSTDKKDSSKDGDNKKKKESSVDYEKNYKIKSRKDGNITLVNKTDPKDTVTVKGAKTKAEAIKLLSSKKDVENKGDAPKKEAKKDEPSSKKKTYKPPFPIKQTNEISEDYGEYSIELYNKKFDVVLDFSMKRWNPESIESHKENLDRWLAQAKKEIGDALIVIAETVPAISDTQFENEIIREYMDVRNDYETVGEVIAQHVDKYTREVNTEEQYKVASLFDPERFTPINKDQVSLFAQDMVQSEANNDTRPIVFDGSKRTQDFLQKKVDEGKIKIEGMTKTKKTKSKTYNGDQSINDIIADANMNPDEKIDAMLDVRQDGKEFKDAGDRVSGSAKETRARKLVMESGDIDLKLAMAKRMTVKEILAIKNKEDSLDAKNLPSVEQDKKDGVPAYIAKMKQDLVGAINNSPNAEFNRGKTSTRDRYVQALDETNFRRSSEISTDLVMDAINNYEAILNDFVKDISKIKTVEDLQAFSDKYVPESPFASPYIYQSDSVNITAGFLGHNVQKMIRNRKAGDVITPTFALQMAGKLETIENDPAVMERFQSMVNYDTLFATGTAKEKRKTDLSHGNFLEVRYEDIKSVREVADSEISTENLQKSYGFKSVQLGNTMEDDVAKQHIKLTMQSIEDASTALNFNFAGFINKHELSIAYGARGSRGANAHYEPSANIINITKKNGDGSFFHELMHFVDDHANKDGYRKSLTSKKTRYYSADKIDALSTKLTRNLVDMQLPKTIEFKPQAKEDQPRARYPRLDRMMETHTPDQIIEKFGKALNHSTMQYIANKKGESFSAELMVGKNSDFFQNAVKLNGGSETGYWATPVELFARASQSYVEDRMSDAGIDNKYNTNSTIGDERYPQGAERAHLNSMFDQLFVELRNREGGYTGSVSPQFKIKGDTDIQMTAGGKFIESFKDRYNVDFDVQMFDVIYANKERGVFADGLTYDNTIALARDMSKGTAEHEILHLAISNLDKISGLSRYSRDELLEAQANIMGIELNKGTSILIEEKMAQDFEKFMANEYQPRGKIRLFFYNLKKRVLQIARAIVNSDRRLIDDYFQALSTGQDADSDYVRLRNTGAINDVMSGSELDAELLPRLPLFKLKRESDSVQRVWNKYNQTVKELASYENSLERGKDRTITEMVDKQRLIDRKSDYKRPVAELVKYTTKDGKLPQFDDAGTRKFELEGEAILSRMGYESIEEAQLELDGYYKTKTQLNAVRKQISRIRKSIQGTKGNVKEVKQQQKDIVRTLNTKRRELEVAMRAYDSGEKAGVTEGKRIQREVIRERKMKREMEKAPLESIKKVYKKLKQATRTGNGIDVKYQKILLEIFDNYDLKTPTKATLERLQKTREYIESVKGKDADVRLPDYVERDLARLAKTPLSSLVTKNEDGTANLELINELNTTILRLFQHGVTLNQLKMRRDKRAFEDHMVKLLASTTQGKLEATTIGVGENLFVDPARITDNLDGKQNYKGANYQMVQNMAKAEMTKELEKDSLISEAFEKMNNIATDEYWTEERMARITHQMAVDQGGETQADMVRKRYPDYDFQTQLSEKEFNTLEVMRDTFREIAPRTQAVVESTRNIPFPTNEMYFPFKYDRELNVWDINDGSALFDFQITSTKDGFTVAREQRVDKVLDTNIFDVFARSVSEQMHFIHMQPELDTLKNTVNDKRYQKKAGVDANKFWKNYIESVATNGGAQYSLASRIRNNISTATLTYKATSTLIQPIVLINTHHHLTQEFGVVEGLKLYKNFVKGIMGSSAPVVAESDVIATRRGGQVELMEIQRNFTRPVEGRFKAGKKLYRNYQKYGYEMMKYMDTKTAGSAYLTFKDAYMKKGMSEQEAVDRAGFMLTRSQGSTLISLRPEAFNRETYKWMLPFQTFVVAWGNYVKHEVVATKYKDKGVKGVAMSVLFYAPFIIAELMVEDELYRNYFNILYGEDEDRNIPQAIYSGLVGRLPMINMFANFDGEFDGQTFRHPAYDTISKFIKGITGIMEDGEGTDYVDVLSAIGRFTGVQGTAQIEQLLDGLVLD